MRKMWVMLEQWLELGDWAELGTVADCGTWVMLDEGLEIETAGFQGGRVQVYKRPGVQGVDNVDEGGRVQAYKRPGWTGWTGSRTGWKSNAA